MATYRIVDEYGKKGVEVREENKIIRFYAYSQIALNSRIKIPANLKKEDIPEYERDEHYRISQLYYIYERLKFLSNKKRELIEEVEKELPIETALQWEKNFRYVYYSQYIDEKNKIS